MIPLRRWRALGSTLYWVALFGLMLLSFGSAFVAKGWDAKLRVDGWGAAWLSVYVAFGLLWIVVTWISARRAVRILASPGLRLDDNGFEFLGERWRWNDIAAIDRVESSDGEGGKDVNIRVTPRPENVTRSDAQVTGIDPRQFDWAEPLEDVLRDWLRRYGLPSASGAEPRSLPEPHD